MYKFNIPLDLKPHSWKTTDKSVPLFIAVKTIMQTLKKSILVYHFLSAGWHLVEALQLE